MDLLLNMFREDFSIPIFVSSRALTKSRLTLSQHWSAVTLQNDTLVLDSSSTTTGSDSMNLVLRQGVLHLGESYNFTLHVTDDSLDGEGAASITLHHNMPPDGGECHLRRGGETGQEQGDKEDEVWRIETLLDRVQFRCSGNSDGQSQQRTYVMSFQNHSFSLVWCIVLL